jgi:hypothetical protein
MKTCQVFNTWQVCDVVEAIICKNLDEKLFNRSHPGYAGA